MYGLEVCPMKKRLLSSLEFVLTNCFMKIFKTKSKDVVIECMSFFDFPNIGTAINARREKFLRKFIVNFNVMLCLHCCRSDRVECGQGTFTLRLLAHSCRCTRSFGFDFQLSLGNGLILFKWLWRLLNCAFTYKYVICWYDDAIAYPVFCINIVDSNI